MTLPFERIFWICLWLGGLGLSKLSAQCPIEAPDTLVWLDFETPMPAGWEALPTSDGGEWQQDAGKIGFFENPGSGNWLYVNDEAADDIGEAYLLSPLLPTSGYAGRLELSFLINFQQYDSSGRMSLMVKSQDNWEPIYELGEDFQGRIQVDLSAFAGIDIQLGWQYEDGGIWNWGMGIDQVLLMGQPAACDNSFCGYGESPEACPGDCPPPPAQAPYWIPPGEDLTGQPVSYRSLLGGSRCDDCSEEVPLGFLMEVWGERQDRIWINSNGNVSFGQEHLVFTPDAFCLEGPNLIAPFFADADLRGGGRISYYRDPAGHYLIVNWENLRFYGCEGAECELTNRFQLILTDGSLREVGGQPLVATANVIFNFDHMSWTTGNSSGGQQGFGGSPATVGINAGDGVRCYDYGTFDRPSYTYYGNQQEDQCPPNGVAHLTGKSLLFQSNTGRMASPPVFTFIQGIYEDEGHLVRWKTDPTAEVDWFVLERSRDSLQFEEVLTVSPADALGPDPEFLQALDQDPYPDTSYYRVTSISPMGEVEISGVVSIVLPTDTVPPRAMIPLHILEVGPNPFERELRFQVSPPPEVGLSYVLVDLSGRTIVQGSLDPRAAATWHSLPLPDMTSGLYIFRVECGGQPYAKRLLRK
jgi:hypothetical protein